MSPPGEEREIHHLLLWLPNWIGDVVFALPTVQALRRRYPEARLTAVARPPAHEFLVCHPALDSVIAFPLGKERGLFSQMKFALGLRKYRFDLAVVFPNSWRSALLAALAGAPRRIGYATDGRGMLLTDAVTPEADSRKRHGADYFAGIVRPLGITRIDKAVEPLNLPAAESETARGLIDQWRGNEGPECLVAVSPGASKPEKRWHAERFGILCQKLIKERQARILLLGSHGEIALMEQIRGFCPETHVALLAGLNLQVVAGLLRHCRLLVANDSGLMNLGAMVGTPVVAIFGPGHPSTTDPLIAPERKEIVTLNFPCSPCRHRFFKECEPSPHNKPYCIEDISVSQVSEAVERLLKRLG